MFDIQYQIMNNVNILHDYKVTEYLFELSIVLQINNNPYIFNLLYVTALYGVT